MVVVWAIQIMDGRRIDVVGVASPLEEVKVVVGRWVAPPLVEVSGVVVSKEEVKVEAELGSLFFLSITIIQ